MGRHPGEPTKVETRLAAWRVHRGAQEELAAAVGMSLTAYRRIERGIERNPGIQHLVNICLALDCSMTELTGLALKPECWTAFDAAAAEVPDREALWRRADFGPPEDPLEREILPSQSRRQTQRNAARSRLPVVATENGHRRWRLVQGDALGALRNMQGKRVDAVVTDPPYEIDYGGNDWDRTGIAFSVELWREVLRMLKPGGHVLAFAAGRTYHRLAGAIEDAGFEPREQLMWVNGQGPLGGQNARLELERLGVDAAAWDGYRTDLKTGQQPIVLARRPLEGTLAENLLRWGTGALNVEGCRLAYTPEDEKGQPAGPQQPGRYPANLLLSEAGADALDAQASPSRTRRIESSSRCAGTRDRGSMQRNRGPRGYSDSGGPSRFFYVAKASASERRLGLGPRTEPNPTTKPLALMRHLVRLVAPPADAVGGPPLLLDPFSGSAVSGAAALREGCRFIGVELRPAQVRHARWRLEA